MQIDMTFDREHRIFPGEYEKNQINLFYDIQYNEQSIVLQIYNLYLCPQTMVELWKEKI